MKTSFAIVNAAHSILCEKLSIEEYMNEVEDLLKSCGWTEEEFNNELLNSIDNTWDN
jgi:hypothetical protein